MEDQESLFVILYITARRFNTFYIHRDYEEWGKHIISHNIDLF